MAVACHPGYAATNLQTAGPGEGIFGLVLVPLMKVANLFLAQSDEMGALPTLYAATAGEVVGSDFIGPDGIGQSRGHPTQGPAESAATARMTPATWTGRRETAVRGAREELTGVSYAARSGPSAAMNSAENSPRRPAPPSR